MEDRGRRNDGVGTIAGYTWSWMVRCSQFPYFYWIYLNLPPIQCLLRSTVSHLILTTARLFIGRLIGLSTRRVASSVTHANADDIFNTISHGWVSTVETGSGESEPNHVTYTCSLAWTEVETDSHGLANKLDPRQPIGSDACHSHDDGSTLHGGSPRQGLDCAKLRRRATRPF